MPTIIINVSKDKLNNFDYKNMELAKKGCSKRFKTLPCLITFIKKDVNKYHGICGVKR
jgi:hypothetical protein